MIIPLGPESLQDSSGLPEGHNGPGQPSPPIWPCSTRGLPCPRCCHRGGGLLPHLFTLALRSRPVEDDPKVLPAARHRGPAPAVCFLWHCPWPSPPGSLALTRTGPDPLALPGALPFSPTVAWTVGLRSPDFPPGRQPLEVGPAITRPARHLHYTQRRATSQCSLRVRNAIRGRFHASRWLI